MLSLFRIDNVNLNSFCEVLKNSNFYIILSLYNMDAFNLNGKRYTSVVQRFCYGSIFSLNSMWVAYLIPAYW